MPDKKIVVSGGVLFISHLMRLAIEHETIVAKMCRFHGDKNCSDCFVKGFSQFYARMTLSSVGLSFVVEY